MKMMLRSSLQLILSLLVSLAPWTCWTADNARASSYGRSDGDGDYPVTTVYRFPGATWVENLAVRRNGLILVIAHTSPLLYQLDPDSSAAEPTVVYDFSAAGRGIQGIVEIDEDVFAVHVTTCTIASLDCTRPTFNAWEVDLRRYGRRGGRDVRVRKVADFPTSAELTGMAMLSRGDSAVGAQVLIADWTMGAVWKLNMRTGENGVVIRDESMVGTEAHPVGVNGLQVRGDRLWFTNTDKGTLNVMPIDPVTGEKRGDVRVIHVGRRPNDFELGEGDDEAFVITTQLVVVRPLKGGAAPTVKVIAELAGATSVRRGRSRIDEERKSLYASTLGSLAQWLARNVTEEGTVVRIDLKG